MALGDYKYQLEKYRGPVSRYTCPSCGGKKEFTRYVNTETGEQLADHVGMCNRMDKCQYHYTPKQYFEDHPTDMSENIHAFRRRKDFKPPKNDTPKLPPFEVSNELFRSSLNKYDMNNYAKYLTDNVFNEEITRALCEKYFIGTSKHWPGATIFWQVDVDGNIRGGKVMLYDHTTGRRVKEPFDHVMWVHSILKQQRPDICLFGEHLLKDKTKTVAIVESEKTAVIASIYFPQYLWLASGGMQGLTEYKCRVLKGRDVILFPDKGQGFKQWCEKAKQFYQVTKFRVNDMLEPLPCEDGSDLADLLVQHDYREINSPEDSLQRVIEQYPLVDEFIRRMEALGMKTERQILNN